MLFWLVPVSWLNSSAGNVPAQLTASRHIHGAGDGSLSGLTGAAPRQGLFSLVRNVGWPLQGKWGKSELSASGHHCHVSPFLHFCPWGLLCTYRTPGHWGRRAVGAVQQPPRLPDLQYATSRWDQKPGHPRHGWRKRSHGWGSHGRGWNVKTRSSA